MVICTFFLNNNCRYGNQCKKEHIDLRLLVKADIDAVIKGHQWPLSTYSPFKDRPSLPNFIVDQSFEEHRAAAYAAKTTGTMPALSAQIAQSVADANLRMQQLYELNGDTLNMLVQLYNSNPASTDASGSTSYHNPFTKVNKPAVVNNPFASTNNQPLIAGNPFASGATSATSGGGSNIFGAPSTTGSSQPNPFANTGNLFGAPSATTAASSGNIFGGRIASQTAGTGSIFGGGGASSTFGTSSSNVAAGNIFGQAQPQQQPSNNIFGGGTTTAPSASVFGGAPTFGGTSAGNIFGGGDQMSQQSGANLFGQPAPGGSIFGGGAAPAMPEGGAFGATPSVFGGAAASNVFAQQPAAGSTNAFGNSTFATAGQPFGQPDVSSNGGQQMMAPAANNEGFFGAPSVFGTAPTPAASNPFMNNAQQPTSVGDPSVYSKIEELLESELAAFGAPSFEVGKIPVHPPPQQFCV